MIAVLAALLLALAAQSPPPPPAPTEAPSPAPTEAPSPAPTEAPSPAPTEADYAVGAGDVLEVIVFDNPDLSRTATVQTSGVVALPLLGEVNVSGLSTFEIQRKLTALLERDFLVDPKVEVKIREYQSQFVIVLGEVNRPGRKPIRGRTRLIDVLIEAGGFKPEGSGEILITRTAGTFEGGKDSLRLELGRAAAISPQDRVNLEIALRNGDLINVLTKSEVAIEGEVARPGRYPIDGSSTVSQLVVLAGGLTRFGSNDVKIRRIDPKSGEVEILSVDLKEIRNGKRPDVSLQANDVVSVPRRRF